MNTKRIFYSLLLLSLSYLSLGQGECVSYTITSNSPSVCGINDGSLSVEVTASTGGTQLTQNCFESVPSSPVTCNQCDRNINDGNPVVGTGETVCMTQAYNGTVIVDGGTLVICTSLNAPTISFKSGHIYTPDAGSGATGAMANVILQNATGPGERTFHAYSAITIWQGDYEGSINNFNSFSSINNVTIPTDGFVHSQGDLQVGENLVNNGVITNHAGVNVNAFGVTGNMTNNGVLNNYCTLAIDGQYIENGTRSDHDASKVTNGGGSSSTCTVTWKRQQGSIFTTVGTGANISGLPAGTYKMEVDCGNGCVKSEIVTLEKGVSDIDFTANSTAATNGCNGVIKIDPTGGFPPYSYKLNNVAKSLPFDNLCASTYEIKVEDSRGCSIMKSQTVQNLSDTTTTDNCVSDVTFTKRSPSICGGNDGELSISLNTQGGQLLQGESCIDNSLLPSPEGCDNCDRVLTVGDVNITVSLGQKVCVPGSYTGDLIIDGGTLVLCAGSAINNLTFNSGELYVNAGSIVYNLNNAEGSGKRVIHNHGGLTIHSGNYEGSLYNYAAFRSESVSTNSNFTIPFGGNVYSQGDFFVDGNIVNNGTIINHGVNAATLNKGFGAGGTITNNNVLTNYCIVHANSYIENGIRNDYDATFVSGGSTLTNCTITWSQVIDGVKTVVGTGTTITGIKAGKYEVEINCGSCDTYTKEVVLEDGVSTITFTDVVTNANGGCNGSIDITNVSGGVPAYRYFLDDTEKLSPFDGICPGPHVVKVVDNKGCSTEKSIDLIDDNNPNCVGISLVVDELKSPAATTCDGEYKGVVTGAQGTVSYKWKEVGNEVLLSTTEIYNTACKGASYILTVTDQTSNCELVALVEAGKVVSPCGTIITPNHKNESCFEAADGMVSVTITENGTNMGGGDCIDPSMITPTENCDVCDEYLSGNIGYKSLHEDKKYCVRANESVSGTFSMSRGKLVVCGDISGVNLSLGGGEIHLLGNTFFNNVSSWGTHSVKNYGELNFNSFSYNINHFENYGTITASSFAQVSSPNVFVNYNKLTIANNLGVIGTLKNYGTIEAGSHIQTNGGALLENFCTLNILGAIQTIGRLENSGQIVAGGSWQINGGATYDGKDGSGIEVNGINLIGTLNGGTNTCSSIQNNGVFNFTSGAVINGHAEACGFTTGLGLNIGANVNLTTCEAAASCCQVTWKDSQGIIVGTGEKLTGLSGGTYTYIVNCGGCETTGAVVLNSALKLDGSITELSEASCLDKCDGEAEVVIVGGTAPYHVKWDNGLIGKYNPRACAGDHYIEVRDKYNCLATISGVINAPDVVCCSLDVVKDVTNATNNCTADGAAKVEGANGESPYSYLWNTGKRTATLSGVQAGNYTVRVTDEDLCSKKETVIIGSNTTSSCTMSLNLTSTPASCPKKKDGTLQVDLVGGVGAYTYEWRRYSQLLLGENTASLANVAYGYYEVIVTDQDGNQVKANTYVGYNNEICDGDLVTKLCEVFFLKKQGNTTASCGTAEDGGIKVQVVNGTSPFAFTWDGTKTGAYTKAQPTLEISSLLSGDYHVTVTDANKCFDEVYEQVGGSQSCHTVVFTVQTTNTTDKNTSDGQALITITNYDQTQNYIITITDQNGNIVFTGTQTDLNNNGELTVTGLTLGVYTVNVSIVDQNNVVVTTNDQIFTIKSAKECIVTPTIVNTGCPGTTEGSIALMIDGGVNPSISWDPSRIGTGSTISGLGKGSYKVVISDVGNDECSFSETYKINEVYIPENCEECKNFIPTITEQKGTGCGLNGTILTVSPSGSSYTWSTGEHSRSIKPTVQGVYSVDVTNAQGCKIENVSTTLTDNSLQLADNSIKTSGELLCEGGSITLTAENIPGASYTWYPDASIGTGNTAVVTKSGSYWVSISKGGCTVPTRSIFIEDAPNTGTVKLYAPLDLTVCPDGVGVQISSSISQGISWYKDDVYQGNAMTYIVRGAGTYRLDVQIGDCEKVSQSVVFAEDCSNTPVTTDPICDPYALFIGNVDPNDLVSCKDHLKEQAQYNATQNYNNYIDGLKEEFRQGYIEHCLNVNEKFTIKNTGGETVHHYTLYYYDQAGNLVRTIPPEGVVPLEEQDDIDAVGVDRTKGEKNIIPTHSYATTYTYNSLNQLIGQSVPDNDRIQKFAYGTPSLSAPNTIWGGGELTASGNGIIYGTETNGSNTEGVIYHTQDGGKTWEKLETLGIGDLNAVQYIDDTHIAAVGDEGTFVYYEQATQATGWKIKPINSPLDFHYIFFFTTTSGIVVNNMGVVYKTEDGGNTWEEKPSQLTNAISGTLQDLHFITEDVGYAINKEKGTSEILKTIDGGITWVTQLIDGTNRKPSDIVLAGGETYIVGDAGLLLRKEDGGTWQFITTGLNTENIVKAEEVDGNLVVSVDDDDDDDDDDYYSIDPIAGTSASIGAYSQTVRSPVTNELIARNNTTITNLSTEATTTVPSVVGIPTGFAFEVFDKDFLYWKDKELFLGGTEITSQTFDENIIGGKIKHEEVTVTTDNGQGNITSTTHQVYDVIVITEEKVFYKVDLTDQLVPQGGTATAWEEVTMPLGFSRARKVHFVDEENAFLVTEDLLYRTNDGGAVWTVMSNTTPSDLNIGSGKTLEDVAFTFTSNAIYGTTPAGVISQYTDGDWLPITIAAHPMEMDDLAFDESSDATTYTGYVVGEGGQVISIESDGTDEFITDEIVQQNNRWTSVTVDQSNSSDAVITDADGNYLTVDNNTINYTAVTNSLTPVQTKEASRTYALTSQGVSEYDNSDWLSAFSSTELLAIDTRPDGKLVAVGKLGKIVLRDNTNSGTYTEQQNVVTTVNITDANIFSGGTGYGVGENGSIIKTTDGGKQWIVLPTPTNQQIDVVDFYDENNGLIAGQGYVFTTTDGGRKWVQVATNITSGKTYNDAKLISATEGYLVGNDGLIQHLNNGMLNTQLKLTDENLNSVDFPDATRGYAVGDAGTMLRLVVGGSWEKLEENTTTTWSQSLATPAADLDLYNVSFKDRFIGYATGENGLMIKTLNGGDSWKRTDDIQNTNTEPILLAISFEDDKDAIVVGNTGVQTLRDQRDRFSTLFWYDELGRLVLSQNAKQFNKSTPAYSYTFYDALGRIIEVGEVANTANPDGLQGELNTASQITELALKTFVEAGTRTEITKTGYDIVNSRLVEVESYYTNNPVGFDNTTLRNRVAMTYYMDVYDANAMTNGNYDYATFYKYDIHGNVKTLVQENTKLKSIGQQYKRTDYDYDLVSGNVNEVRYQAEEVDQLIHRYEYDADNRITNVMTSIDGVVWDEDAIYAYYKHGPLMRTEIGENKVQGTDYAYTIHGWLKGVNSNTLNSDIGEDGETGTNSLIPSDEFGFSLGYYTGDYKSISNQVFASPTAGAVKTNTPNLYNGNIKEKVTATAHFMKNNLGTVVTSPTVFGYKYDQLNRLKEAKRYKGDVNGGQVSLANTTSTTDHQVNLTYDANGNIVTLTRNAVVPQAGGTNNMDDFEYAYKNIANGFERNTNQLLGVHDKGDHEGHSNPNLTEEEKEELELWGDLRTGQNTTLDNANYKYDGIGNLIQDTQEEIAEIEWTVYGKVWRVIRTSGSQKPDLEFDYDASGNRVMKLVKTKDDNGNLNPIDQWVTTYYVRDASGNTMAIYKQEGGNYVLLEQSLYGSSRLGVFKRNVPLINVGDKVVPLKAAVEVIGD